LLLADASKEVHMLGEPMVARIGAQGLVEYALIIALVAVMAIAGLLMFGPQLNSLLSQLSGSV
jgi:Flp pilus assembly pilin Flp